MQTSGLVGRINVGRVLVVNSLPPALFSREVMYSQVWNAPAISRIMMRPSERATRSRCRPDSDAALRHLSNAPTITRFTNLCTARASFSRCSLVSRALVSQVLRHARIARFANAAAAL